MKSSTLTLLLLSLTLLASCTAATTGNGTASERPAPWGRAHLRAGDVPEVYLTEWRRAGNRVNCDLLAFVDLPPGATPRRAEFSGGWGIAYDTAGTRSAFGVAGTGISASGPQYGAWPHTRTWADGSNAGYGPEGGTGPNQLAYLRIVGQDCLYNVWSRQGVEHLESLLERLRFVDTQ